MRKYDSIKNVVLLLIFLLLSLPYYAQYVPTDHMRFTEWNPGLNSVGGIPERTTIYTTLSPSGGEDSDIIQAAIDACPSGQVVQLTAGTFILNDYVIINKDITLRGEGPGITILEKTDGAIPDEEYPSTSEPVIIVGPGRWPGPDESTSQNLTADGNKGDMSVTIENGNDFEPGQFVLLDEYSGASWQPDRLGHGQIWASPDYRAVWNFNILPGGDTVGEPITPTTPTGGPAASWYCRQDRVTSEIKEVESVAGNIITFTSPLHINYRTSHTAQLTRYTDAGNGGVHIAYAGIEDLTVTRGTNGNIIFTCTAYSWMKNVDCSVFHGGGVAIHNSFRLEIRDSYIHDAAWPCPGGAGYAIIQQRGCSEILFENNVIVRANKVMVARCAGAGSVFGYNYADQGFINYNSAWIECGLNASHMTGPHHVLFEGNYGFNWDSDNTHGNSIYMTVFRNHLRGIRKPFTNPHNGGFIDDSAQTGNGPKRCIGAMGYSYWMTFIGNILGAEDQMNGWLYESSGTRAMANPGIWMLGWDATEPYYCDTNVTTTAVRDGNWDWVQEQQSWHNSSPVTFQNSLYLSDKPAFFGDNPWPWVDPETGTVYTLPAKKRFDSLDAGITQQPLNFSLQPNYPNPFTKTTAISYQLPVASHVTLKIFDKLGREITTLVNEIKQEGTYTTLWDGTDRNGKKVSSGTYFYQISGGTGEPSAKKMIFLR
jgi:hypothetical protein